MIGGKIESRFVPDPLETYAFDYSRLNSILKTTTASITYHPNGMIKSVNADVEDRTAQVITSVGGAVLNLYKASTLSFVPTAAPVVGACDAFLADKITARRDLIESKIPAAKSDDDALAKDKGSADELSVKLEQTKARLVEAKKAKDQSSINSLTSDVANLQGSLVVAVGKLKGRSLKLPSLKAKLDALTRSLTVTLQTKSWAPKGDAEEVCAPITVSQSSFLDKLANLESAEIKTDVLASEVFSVDVCAAPVSNSRKAKLPPEDSDISYEGLVYRMPASGAVWIRNSLQHDERVDAGGSVNMPQFGAKGLIWLKNHMFDKNNVKVAFGEDGSPNELTFSAQSSAERAASAASDISGTIVELMSLRAEAVKAQDQAIDSEQRKEQQKQLTAIDDQIALLQKRKDLEAARLPTKDAYDKEKERLQKEIELERLRQELSELRNAEEAQ